MPWATIPRTFQDAIETARAIGLEYIWIDSLCIVQDDPEDWKAESKQMMAIYSNAYLTIAATWGTSSDSGCHTTRAGTQISVWSPLTLLQPLTGFLATKPSVYARAAVRHDEMSKMPLLSRGWVLQE
jgi:hypothetical protein